MQHPMIKIPPRMGFREYRMAAAILNDLAEHGFPVDWSDEKSPLSIGYNPESGCVYLCNEEGDCAMMNGDRLEVWYYLGYAGDDGFFEDLRRKYANNELRHEEDREAFREIAERRGIYLI